MSKLTEQEIYEVVEVVRLLYSYREDGNGEYIKGYIAAKGVDALALSTSMQNAAESSKIEAFDSGVMDKMLDKLISLYQDGVFDKFKGE